METLLRKMAQRLDGIDEASLNSLWSKYLKIVVEGKLDKEWETAAIVLGLIQAKHRKNQLLNHSVREASRVKDQPVARATRPAIKRKPCPVLQFRPRQEGGGK